MTYRLAAEYYDLFGSKEDLNFYKELALQSGGKALELGVGTARVAIPLARVGVTVVSIDNSVYMLQVAREKLAKESEAVRRRVTLKKEDMKDFQLNQSFPFIYIPASTFDHNIAVEDQKRTLECVHEHLEKSGTFAFDLEQVPPNKPEVSWWVDRKKIEGGKMVVRSIFTRMDMTKRTCSLDLFFNVYKKGKLLESFYEYGRVAMISKGEIIRLLEETGFKVVCACSDFDKSRYRKGTSKVVLVAEKN